MKSRRHLEGLSFVELATAISLVCVIAAVFVPAFLRNVRTSKTAEAAELLDALHQRTAAYFAARLRDEEGRVRSRCLPASAGPTPAMPSTATVEVDFGADPAFGATWQALGFAPDRPTRFRYSILTESTDCNLDDAHGKTMVTFVAEGDLDGDGTLSRYERRATINASGALVPKDVLFVRDRTE